MQSGTKHLTGRVDQKQIQLLEKISKEEKIDRSAALRKVLDIGIREYMKRKAVEDYRKGRISVGRAAEEAEVSIAEFYNILEGEGIPIKVDTGILKEIV
ncbi:MAG: UPF0175 family protein [Thaumarchaeota archaeon]|nr:UPF0175 family protein [Nitrososphaerota archaeon]